MDQHKILSLIRERFSEATISFIEDDCNSVLEIVSSDFEHLSLLERHRIVMGLLSDYFKSGELHSLSLKVSTPQENQ
tara:strand:+ start:14922 stop:15152 length:231 start_codon:yes stop_codon:yes gene_type:complete